MDDRVQKSIARRLFRSLMVQYAEVNLYEDTYRHLPARDQRRCTAALAAAGLAGDVIGRATGGQWRLVIVNKGDEGLTHEGDPYAFPRPLLKFIDRVEDLNEDSPT